MTGRAQPLVAPLDELGVHDLSALVARAARAAGHPVLSEAQIAALPTPGADGGGSAIRAVYAGREEAGPLGLAQAIASPPDGHLSVEVVVDPRVTEPTRVRAELLECVADRLAAHGGGLLRLWVRWADPGEDWPLAAGFAAERDLLQLRCPLPLPDDGRPGLPTRAFRPGGDEAAWVRANNRAFAGHPEQGGWDTEVLRRREDEPWFDPAGFLVHDADGVIAAWCWTKVHGDTEPPMGEIYVIGVDPDFQGRGWGRALTRAGLDWLAAQGLTVGMLYVDAANESAVGLYRSLGFVEDHRDRSFRRPVEPPAG